MTSAYRYAIPDDDPFIISGWSSSYRTSDDHPMMQMETYAVDQHARIRAVLARPRVQVIVAHGEVLRGFIVYELSAYGLPPLLWYVYVAQPYRRMGIAHGLFVAARIDPREPFEYACRTRVVRDLRHKAPAARRNTLRGRFTEERRS